MLLCKKMGSLMLQLRRHSVFQTNGSVVNQQTEAEYRWFTERARTSPRSISRPPVPPPGGRFFFLNKRSRDGDQRRADQAPLAEQDIIGLAGRAGAHRIAAMPRLRSFWRKAGGTGSKRGAAAEQHQLHRCRAAERTRARAKPRRLRRRFPAQKREFRPAAPAASRDATCRRTGNPPAPMLSIG